MKDTIALTRDQVASLRAPEGDWLRMTPEQQHFIKSTPPGMTCFFFDEVIVRVSEAQLTAAMEVAFKTAANAALQLINSPQGVQVQLSCKKPELGQTYLTVTATDDDGRTANGIGMIPDPRMH